MTYLFQDKGWGYRSGIWREGRSSICLRFRGWGCHTLSLPAELLHRNYVSSLQTHSISPTAHPPGTTQQQARWYPWCQSNKTEQAGPDRTFLRLPWCEWWCFYQRRLLGSTPYCYRSWCRPPKGSVESGRPAGRGPCRCTTAWSRAACRGRAWSRARRRAHIGGAGCSWNQEGCLTVTAAFEAGPTDSLLQK